MKSFCQFLPENATNMNTPEKIGPRSVEPRIGPMPEKIGPRRMGKIPACRSLKAGMLERILSKIFFGRLEK